MNRRKFIAATVMAAAAGFGAYAWPQRWNFIAVHHSGGRFATIEFLQAVHRNRQPLDPIDAIPYHYVIGNGNGLEPGEVASDWRNELSIWGAHLSDRNSLRNFLGIGICLVGNFDEDDILPEQFNALVHLTRQLMARYDIPVANVEGHGYIDGERTKCPGRKFPMAEFKREIASASAGHEPAVDAH